MTYEAIVRVHDFHYAGPTSSYIEEKLSTIMGVEQHLLLRIGDTNFYADQLQVDGSGVSLGKFPERTRVNFCRSRSGIMSLSHTTWKPVSPASI